ncbi:RING-H2 finger protein ATL68-like [Mangifera indica]|uniref:RING-H2 finger protein ATL68-like n=1 Tax=Mangifera indica TaxID=29780 RepID=UPI001CFA0DB6|nr:RING-H2 finger protein ATL68-like [Mangifera indica]
MSSPTSSSPPNYLTNLGLGYSIAIALGFFVLLSTIFLASYICCRYSRHRNSNPQSNNPNTTHNNPNSDGIILPRVFFVAEDDDDQDQNQDDNDNLVVGLGQSVINSYPKFQFTKDNISGGGFDSNNTTCSICLCEYKDYEMLRMMPECRHFFHLGCVDAWLKLNGSCPVCRNSPLPTPLSTPLQEVVPLAQYAADRRRS